jgi:hypothetical protein
VHQFDKVEMFSFVDPATSGDEHERLLAIEEEILQELEIPYRVVNVAAGDLGASAAKKYDCEAWIPGQGRYRELTSFSNTTDYQARRLRARFRSEPKGSPRPVHTLNGTAVAVGRTILALIENHQTAAGGFHVPAVLHPFGSLAAVPPCLSGRREPLPAAGVSALRDRAGPATRKRWKSVDGARLVPRMAVPPRSRTRASGWNGRQGSRNTRILAIRVVNPAMVAGRM